MNKVTTYQLETVEDLADVIKVWHETKLKEFYALLETAPSDAHRETLQMVIERIEKLPFETSFTVTLHED